MKSLYRFIYFFGHGSPEIKEWFKKNYNNFDNEAFENAEQKYKTPDYIKKMQDDYPAFIEISWLY